MSENTSNKIALVNLPEMPDSLDNATKNLTDMPSKNVGQTLGDIWYLVFGFISQAADKKRLKYSHDLNKYKQELDQAILEIPEEKRIEPSIQVTAQALENSKYCVSSEKLREMFVKLVSGTMNRDLEPHVHPSFPEIIKQMSENDALLLQYFKTKNIIPIATIGIKSPHGGVYYETKHVCVISDLSLTIHQCCVSISALEKAGLLETSYLEWLNDDSSYDLIRKSELYASKKALSKSKGASLSFGKGMCSLTPLGYEFIEVCL